MAVNQSYVMGWLVERFEWESTLAELHAHAQRPQRQVAGGHCEPHTATEGAVVPHPGDVPAPAAPQDPA